MSGEPQPERRVDPPAADPTPNSDFWRDGQPSPLGSVARRLLFDAASGRGLVIGIAGLDPGEDVTSVVAELADRLAAASAARTVLVVDCKWPGGQTLEAMLRRLPRVSYRTLGAVRGMRLPEGMDLLRDRHAFVLFDLPPLIGDSLARELVADVDRLYLVVRAGATPMDRVGTALELVGRDRVDGFILVNARRLLPRWLERLFS